MSVLPALGAIFAVQVALWGALAEIVPNYNKGYNMNLRKRIQARRKRIKITKLKAKTKNNKI